MDFRQPEDTPKDGNMPQYIKNVPWYVDNKSQQSLNHQKFLAEPKKVNINEWYDRGKKGYQSTNYRKGACQNCGAMGHKKKECTERPRKTGAKFTVSNIAPDDVIKEIELDWEGKRDAWNSFDPSTHKDMINDEFEVYDEIKKKRKVEDENAEYKQSNNPIDIAQLPSRHDSISINTQGLSDIRNRQDLPNYLRNLDPSSAAYNPKSRVMMDNPNPLLPQDKQVFKGHNSYLNTGQQLNLLEQQRFVQQQAELQNSELNSVALPSLTEQIFKTMKKKAQTANSGKMGELLSKYGGKQYIENKPEQIAETENYLEYTREGKVKKHVMEELAAKSKYPENVYVNDHTSVWGSWWNEHLGWGYSCCHNNVKMSTCPGAKGHQLALQREVRAKKQKLKQEMEQKIKAEQSKQ